METVKSRKTINGQLTKLVLMQRAYLQVKRAIESGKLTRPTKCSKCDKPCKPHAHHDDYAKPIDVAWLCPSCHLKHHRSGQLPAPEFMDEVVKAYSTTLVRPRKLTLSKREVQVANLLALGLRNLEIAEKLGIGKRTAETHRERIYKFCNVGNSARLIGWMLHRKMITVDTLTQGFE